MAELYVDDELNVPVRLTGYDWPAAQGGQPVLLEFYTYTNIQINVELPDSDFNRRALR